MAGKDFYNHLTSFDRYIASNSICRDILSFNNTDTVTTDTNYELMSLLCTI